MAVCLERIYFRTGNKRDKNNVKIKREQLQNTDKFSRKKVYFQLTKRDKTKQNKTIND